VRSLFSLFVLLVFFGISSIGQVGGSSTYGFLKLTNSARVAAIGGQNISIADGDLNFVYHNPALLNKSMSSNLVLNYVNYFAGINYGYTSFAKDFNRLGVFAAGLHYINYGKFIKADPSGKITGEFKAFELAINLFWAKPIIDSMLTLGVNVKPIYSQLETYNSFGLALDAGINYQSKNHLFSGSLVIKNIGTQLKPYYPGNYEPLPFDIQIGISQRLEHAPFRFSVLYHHLFKWDLTYNIYGNPSFTSTTSQGVDQKEYEFNIFDNFFRHTIFGLEFLPSKNFVVMLGYNHQRRKELMLPTRPFLVGFSWGIYLNISKIKLSFGQSIYHLAGSSNHFSVSFNLDDFYKSKK